ncbi:aldehyde ferredoxin oxidoreductase family protein [Thermosediminibacter oceani]|uniref:Aldehyde ferredoxin oxidoreductase n=1 Tax=Thermosediminibacter oceani (strain ATCC BAA-1034 / DSM 16646 / JW/IW-1228P) TaxID=555079 RepID=D9S100_THEOJ|nr:aldehyde ferredoxin oxidoreductase family protein [Thermosediminibacter oceani]ADL07164.1 Aldehyde ferredoxin oxidoreductase [Thermosediminibacter oceani DSM 16646]
MWYGFAGKLLRVNLTNGEVKTEELDRDELRKYMGCTGFAAKILYQEMPGGTDPLAPEAKVVVATGPVTGTLCPSGGSYEVCYKSPLTGTWNQARSGGAFGPKLKYAGFDFVVLEGKAAEPVYLYINDGHAEIKSAKHLWGLTVEETTDALIRELDDPEISIAAIGPAGEKGVLYAALINDRGRAAGRGGIGAVFGSKNLKAVAVKGRGGIKVSRPKQFAEAVEKAEQWLENYPFASIPAFGTVGLVSLLNSLGMLPTKNFQTAHFEGADRISGEYLNRKYQIKRRACYGCTFACGRYTSVNSGKFATPPMEGPEYETVNMFGANCGVDDLETVIKANYLCNAYGLDTISTGMSIGFAMECYEKGLLTDKDTEGMPLRWGDGEVVVKLVEKIAHREGIGEFLAQGVKRMAEQLGPEAEELAVHVKGLEAPAHEPRSESKVLAIQYAVSPRGACHMHPNWASTWDFGQLDGGMKDFGLPWPPAGIPEETSQKGMVYRYVALQGEISEILGACIFYSWGTEGSCITPQLYAEIVSALTGWDVTAEELLLAAERSWNLKRCFNAREGFTRKDDRLPKRFSQAIPDGPSAGARVDNLDVMLDAYYEAMGWDKDTGLPTPEKLKELGLDFAIES